VAITNIWWKDEGYDLHLFNGEKGGPLAAKLRFTRSVGGNESRHRADGVTDLSEPVFLKPGDVTVTFHPEFSAVGAQPAGKRCRAGVLRRPV
jgi:hypothetical protein